MVCCGNPDAKCCGHPSGFVVWVPLMFTLAGLALSAASYNCNLATFADGKSVTLTGTTCTVASDLSSYECNQQNYTSSSIGTLSFRDDSTQQCVTFVPGVEWGPWITSAVVFSGLRWLFGAITLFWLTFSTCCPILHFHKRILLSFAIITVIFQGLFFLFYNNEMCQANGCDLAQGGYIAISGACCFVISSLALFFIPTTTPSWENDTENTPAADLGYEESGSKSIVTGVILGGEDTGHANP